jgi:hypothetical protein
MCAFLHSLYDSAGGGDPTAWNADQLVLCVSSMRGVARSRVGTSAVEETESTMFQGDPTYELRMQKLRSSQWQTVAHLLSLTLPGMVRAVTRNPDLDEDVCFGLLLELFVLMEDYVQFQFSYMSSQSATILYECALSLFMGE